jgi:hypothetical protein
MSTRTTRVGTAVAALVLVLAARDGAAQTSGEVRRVFAGASLAWNIDNSVWSSSGSDRTGGALAVGVAGGFTFADRWSLQVEGEFPTSDRTVVDRHSGAYGGQTYASVYRSTFRTPTIAVLFGVHWRLPKRVDIAFQFGPCLRNEQWSDDRQTTVNGYVTSSDQYSGSDWHWGPSVGGEVAVNVTPRVAVVGQFRLHFERLYLDDPWEGSVVRPAIGVRVRF